MRRRIYLLRHGEVRYFEPDGRPLPPNDVGLTPDGRGQARDAGKVLGSVAFDRVITSGLPRTVETARLTLASAGVDSEIEAWPELREIQPGRLRDIPEDRLPEAFLATHAGPIPESTRFLGGETIGSLLDRVEAALERLLADSAWDTVLMVLHGGVNRALLSHALLGGRGYLGGIEQSAGCINIIDIIDTVGSRDWIVQVVNFTPQNPAHLGPRTTTMERLLEQYRPEARKAK